MNLRRYLSGLICSLLLGTASGQTMSGYRPDPYSGLQSLYRQPAALADMPLRLDVQAGGFDLFAWNDYLGLRRPFLLRDSLRRWEARRPDLVPETLGGQPKSFFFGGDLHLPGIAWRVNDSLGLALSARMRSLSSLRGLGEPLARFLYHDGDRPELQGQSFTSDNLRFLSASFLEVGLGGGATIFRRGPHRLKAGLTLKLSFAMAGAYLHAERLRYRFPSSDSLIIEEVQADFANGLGDTSFTGANVPAGWGRPLPGAPGWGLDLGLLYEHGGAPGEPYRWRLGVALTDLGELNIPRSDDLATFSGAIPEGLRLAELAPGVAYDSVALANFAVDTDREAFALLPPLALTLHGDARLRPEWHLGWTARLGLYSAARPHAFRPPSVFILTPRWQRQWWAVGLPITIDEANQFGMGLTARLGPLTLGSGNVLGLFLTDNVRSGDIFAVLHVPIPYQDRAQPPEPTSPDSLPAPPVAVVDTPVIDSPRVVAAPVDTRPAAPTLRSLPLREPEALTQLPPLPLPLRLDWSFGPIRATPFTDEELAEMKAPAPTPVPAPDRPLTPEQIAAIEQAEAEARRQARAARERGEAPAPASSPQPTRRPTRQPQPFDDSVRTAYNSGPLAQYFPYADADGDGVANRDDACPDRPGLKERRGCPAGDRRGLPASGRAPEGLEIDAFERVYFEAGEAYLDGKARIALNRVANFLRANPGVSLRIVGHADATGGDSFNDRLSARRCEAVRQYLLGKDLAPKRLVIEAYGERMPAASNATEAGRQRNRRVALVLFDPG